MKGTEISRHTGYVKKILVRLKIPVNDTGHRSEYGDTAASVQRNLSADGCREMLAMAARGKATNVLFARVQTKQWSSTRDTAQSLAKPPTVPRDGSVLNF